jgi:hypothetical protein
MQWGCKAVPANRILLAQVIFTQKTPVEVAVDR